MSRVLLIGIFLIASLVVCTRAQSVPCSGENEMFYGCGACDSTCDSGLGGISCPAVCGPGSCGCESGYVRDQEKKCISIEDCPRNESSIYARMGK